MLKRQIFLPRLRVERLDEAADAVLGSGDPEDHLVLDDQRRHRRRVAALVVFELDVVEHRPGLHVQRQQVRIDRRHEQAIAEHAEAAIDRPAAQMHLVGKLSAIAPDRRPDRASIAHALLLKPVM